MLSPDLLQSKFQLGLAYEPYLATGTTAHRASWAAVHARVRLTPPQLDLIAGFTRTLHLLTLSGTWCGDCAQQLPILDHIARANPTHIHLRLIDRDQHADLARHVAICGGLRVPTVLFLTEDFEFLALAGDKSLARLRALAARSLGPSCPLPGAPIPDDELAATTQDWLNDTERAHLLARLSPKLRARHGD